MSKNVNLVTFCGIHSGVSIVCYTYASEERQGKTRKISNIFIKILILQYSLSHYFLAFEQLLYFIKSKTQSIYDTVMVITIKKEQ